MEAIRIPALPPARSATGHERFSTLPLDSKRQASCFLLPASTFQLHVHKIFTHRFPASGFKQGKELKFMRRRHPMKALRMMIRVSLIVVAMLPLTAPAANASTLGSLLGSQAKSLVQQAKGDGQGIGAVDLTHPNQIPGQLVSNAQTAALQAQLQAEQVALQDEQAAVAATQAQIAALQAKLGQCS
jgi:hypothetical protein